MLCDIKLDNFEGPLDLLLHLIKKNEMDIYDIPMTEITSQYLAAIDAMKSLNLDVASEFLVMAATLIHIKSRLLLPQAADEETDEDEVDPRAELVRRLLEYQKYKAAAVSLEAMPQLSRDVFGRGFVPDELQEPAEESFVAVELYDLLQAFQNLLQQLPEETVHEVTAERLSVSERINQILCRLTGCDSVGFTELFAGRPARHEVVVTFLAMLELVRLRLVRVMQSSRFGSIWLFSGDPEPGPKTMEEDAFGYG